MKSSKPRGKKAEGGEDAEKNPPEKKKGEEIMNILPTLLLKKKKKKGRILVALHRSKILGGNGLVGPEKNKDWAENTCTALRQLSSKENIQKAGGGRIKALSMTK